MKRNLAVVFAALAISLVGSLCSAVVTVSEHGTWPDSWPKELERYREQAISMQVAHGIQEDVHEIRFREREDFEQAWPYLLKLKTKGAPLILETSPSTDGASGSAAEKGVRILCPSHGASSGPSDGKMLGVGPPWPDDIKLPNGGLPEYVVNHNGKWVPYDGTNRAGFRYRARVDIVLIVDGKIVDLNRIQIPADTPVIDHRFKGKQDAPDAADDKDEARGEGATSRATPRESRSRKAILPPSLRTTIRTARPRSRPLRSRSQSWRRAILRWTGTCLSIRAAMRAENGMSSSRKRFASRKRMGKFKRS
jgi:hypothetical protein